jgi:prepilin-type N-terminal cleavage/methylation domain-containing protein
MHRDAGLTVIELMVALTIFAIMTAGVIPLLATTLRGTTLSRSYTLGKSLAVAAMERARGLPYFESVQGQTTPQRRDVLDIYFPDKGAGFSAVDNTFTTTCTPGSAAPSASGALACPKDIPTGYTVTFVAAFVKPGATPPVTNPPTPQSFMVEPPSSAYNWNAVATENPPTQLLRMNVSVTWTSGGRARNFALTSLLGQRELTDEQISATAEVAHAVSIIARYNNSAGVRSQLVATAGQSLSDITSDAIAEADLETRAGHLVLTQDAVGESPAETLADFIGASAFVSAPPDSYPASTASMAEQTATYVYSDSSTLSVAFMDDTVVESPSPFSLGARVLNELPTAAGKFRYSGAAGQPSMWVDNQASRGPTSALKLDDTAQMVVLEPDGSTRLSGQTSAEATAVSPSTSRKVEGVASVEFGKLQVLPTTFITHPDDSVVTVSNFTASLSCKSTANATPASVVGTWQATLRYWSDPANDGLTNSTVPGAVPAYVDVPLSGSLTGGSDPLASLKTDAQNPLVYDDPVDANDVYLMDTLTRNGYLTSLSTRPLITSSKSATGRSTSATLSSAISIGTVPTSPGNDATVINVSIGTLSCDAVDRRGL